MSNLLRTKTKEPTTVTVHNGICARTNKSRLLIIGKPPELISLSYEALEAKLGGQVSRTEWDESKARVAAKGCASLSYGDVKLQALCSKPSRHESPAEPSTITKAAKEFFKDGTQSGDVILVIQRSHLLASVAAVARAFSIFSAKTDQIRQCAETKLLRQESDIGETTNKTTTTSQCVNIELLPPDGDLTQPEISYLNEITRSIRDAAALVDTPCSILNTDAMVSQAHAIAKELGVEIKVIRGEELKDGGFGGIYSVGRAAAYPPALVILSHKPAGAHKTTALVGKGIVYDTGGLQIKTKLKMPLMKRDMGAAAAVLMGFRAAVKGGYHQNLHCLLCLAENHIGATATKPDDIITMLSGKTVEVNDTDSEGRLVLGDGVYYARQVLKADLIMDMGTLTGAQTVQFLGRDHAAVMSNSEKLEKKAVLAGRHSGELTHPIVFAPNLHLHLLESEVADMKNTQMESEEVASCVAALFIGAQIDFGKDFEWLHVDMAVPVHDGERATGYGPTLIQNILAAYLSEDAKGLLVSK